MYQQCSRYLFKQIKKPAAGTQLTGYFTYLNDLDKLVATKCNATKVEEFTQLDTLTLALSVRAAYYIKQTTELMNASTADRRTQNNDLFAIQTQRMMRAHIQYLMCLMARNFVDKHEFKDKALQPLMHLLIKIFALKQLLNDSGIFACGYFTQKSQLLLDDSLHQLLVELRPHMVPLVETFSIDAQDYNVIGNKFGDIYELQLDTAKRAKINSKVVPPFYEKYMKPTMKMHKAKL